jgi:hypothetical protein
MRSLSQSLQDYDRGHLAIIAELWGLSLPSGSTRKIAEALAESMRDPQILAEIASALPPEAARALRFLIQQGGKFPLADATRRYGGLRMMGAGKRDREKPWRHQPTAMEALWYRGLIAFAFADTPTGPQEFVYIPTDLISLLPEPAEEGELILGRQVEPTEHIELASDTAAEDAATVLAALRQHPLPDREALAHRSAPFMLLPLRAPLLAALLQEMGVLSQAPLRPLPSPTRALLASPRAAIAAQLLRAWVHSTAWNDLAHISSLVAGDGNWPNDPLATRAAVLGFLSTIPRGAWWGLERFIRDIQALAPSFQRPGGDFDSWYLRDAHSGAFLRGFEHWDAVEGALLRFIICCPLHWLGAVDLCANSQNQPPNAFRLTPFFKALSHAADAPVPMEAQQETHITIQPDGRLTVPRATSLATRYQIARIGAWMGLDELGYHFCLTPSSLQRAQEQGLRVDQVSTILRHAAGGDLPPSLHRALLRWESHGREAHLERLLVLRLQDPSLLERLRKQRSTARYLGETLGPTSVLVRERGWEPLARAAARLGLLIDPPSDGLGVEP